MRTDSETSVEELKAKRKPLADEFEGNPQRLHLAIKIKEIDDQIAEHSKVIRQERRPRPVSKAPSKPGI
jgi:hypothetical protein